MQTLSKSYPKYQINDYGIIHSTRNYDIFKFLKGNRELNLRNLAKIEASNIKQQLIIPIIVNSNFEVIDGQHRLTVWKTLSMPVYFIINDDYGLEQVLLANNSGALWKIEDFLNKHVVQGIPSYLAFDDLVKKYKLNITDVIKLFAHYQSTTEKHVTTRFMQGKFTLDGIENVWLFLDSLEQFSFFPFYKNKAFVRAYFKFYIHERFNLERMLRQIEVRKGQFVKYNSVDDYLYMLATEVYSFGLGKNLINYDRQTKRFY